MELNVVIFIYATKTRVKRFISGGALDGIAFIHLFIHVFEAFAQVAVA